MHTPNHPLIKTSDDRPLFKHDCERCNYLGSVAESLENGRVRVCDVYHSCEGSILMRFSNEGADYSSLPRRAWG